MYKKINIVFLLVCLIIFAKPTNTYASSGWVKFSDAAETKLYGDGTVKSPSDSGGTDDEEDPDIVEASIAKLIFKAANWVNENILATEYFDFTVDGVILGRMSKNCPTTSTGVRVAYSQFTLSYGNPYGIVSAWIFCTLRGLVYSLFLFYFVIKLAPFAFSGGAKRAELKEFIYNIFFFMLLMYVLPYIVDFFIYVRDASIYRVTGILSDKLMESGSAKGAAGKLLAQWKSNYESSPTIVNALLYLATVCAGGLYAAEYFGTALIETGLFGIIPIVCINGARDKKSFSDWCSTFFSNLVIPFLDSIFMMLPVLFVSIFNEVSGGAALPKDASTESSYAAMAIVSFIQLIMIFAIKPTRNAVLKGVNAKFNMQAPKSGIGGLVSMAGMAAMRLGKGGRRGSSGGSDGLEESHISAAEDARIDALNHESINEASEALKNSEKSDIQDVFGDNAENEALTDLEDDHRDPVDEMINDDGTDGSDSLDEYEEANDNEESNAIDELLDEESDSADDNVIDNAEFSDIDEYDDDIDNDIGSAENPDTLDEYIESDEGNAENPEISDEYIEGDGLGDNSVDKGDLESNSEDDELLTSVGETGNGEFESQQNGEESSLDGEFADLNGNPVDIDDAGKEKNDSYYDIPGIDKDTLDSLEGTDRDRFANLSAKDAMEEELSKNEQSISDMKQSMAENELSIARERASIAENTEDSISRASENASLNSSVDVDCGKYEENNRRIAENNYKMAQTQNIDISNEQGTIDEANSLIANERAAITERCEKINVNSQRINNLESGKDAREIARLNNENYELNRQNVSSQNIIQENVKLKNDTQALLNSKVGNSSEVMDIKNQNKALMEQNNGLSNSIRQNQNTVMSNTNSIANNSINVKNSEKYINSTALQNAQTNRDITSMQSRNVRLANGIENANRRENSYAANSKAVGMDGTVYKDASSFATNQKVIQNMKKQANYKNFDSKKFEGVLSPEERVEYARKRSQINTAKKAVKTAGNVASAAVTAGAVVASTYGGPGAMVTAGVVTHMAQGIAKSKVSGVVQSTAKAAGKVGDVANNSISNIRATKKGKIIKAASSYNAKEPYKSSGMVKGPKVNPVSTESRYEQEVKAVKSQFINEVNKSNQLN